jgi:hypothetical protein
MGRKTVLVDDLDGSELPEDTRPINLSFGRTSYALYLSEDNHGKLLEAVEPFIANAEEVNNTATPASSSADKEKMKRVREWAKSTGFKFTDAQGNEKTLGDRGRIPDEVVKAYEASKGA